MAQNKTRTGILLVIAFTLGAVAWNTFGPHSGATSDAALMGSGIGGFKGSDEELKGVTVTRPAGNVASTAGGTPDG